MSCLFNKTSVISVRKGPFTHGQWRTNPISYRDYLVFSRSSRFIIVFFNKVNIKLAYNNNFVADEISFPGLKWPVSVAPRWDADAVGSGLILAVRVTPFHRCDVVWERVFSTLLSGCSRQLSPGYLPHHHEQGGVSLWRSFGGRSSHLHASVMSSSSINSQMADM